MKQWGLRALIAILLTSMAFFSYANPAQEDFKIPTSEYLIVLAQMIQETAWGTRVYGSIPSFTDVFKMPWSGS